MYAQLFSTGQLRHKTDEETYRKIYKELEDAQKPKVAGLPQLSESLRYLENKGVKVLKKEFDCLTNIEEKLNHIIQGVLKGFEENKNSYPESDEEWIEEACKRLKVAMQIAHFIFQSELLQEVLKQFQREVESLSRSIQRRLHHSLGEIKKAVEEAQKTFRVDNVKDPDIWVNVKRCGPVMACVDLRIQQVCGNYDAMEKFSRDHLIKAVQSSKEAFDEGLIRAVEKFEWSITRAFSRFSGDIDKNISPSSRQQENLEGLQEILKDEKIQIEIRVEEPPKSVKIVHSLNTVTQSVEELKGNIPGVLMGLTDMNADWISGLQPQKEEDVDSGFARAYPYLFFCVVVALLAKFFGLF